VTPERAKAKAGASEKEQTDQADGPENQGCTTGAKECEESQSKCSSGAHLYTLDSWDLAGRVNRGLGFDCDWR